MEMSLTHNHVCCTNYQKGNILIKSTKYDLEEDTDQTKCVSYPPCHAPKASQGIMSLIKHVKPLHLLPMHRNVSGKHLLLREAISPLIDVEKAVTLCANINKYTSASNSKIEDPKQQGSST